MRSRKEKTKEQMKRKGQEEMVGFALIIVIVAIIILFFLSFALKSSGKDASESFEIDSFLHSSLQYTTICEERGKNATIRALISSCIGEEECSNGEDSCKILEENLGDMLEEADLDSSPCVNATQNAPSQPGCVTCSFAGANPEHFSALDAFP